MESLVISHHRWAARRHVRETTRQCAVRVHYESSGQLSRRKRARLESVTFRYSVDQINVDELAQLLQQVARVAPSQAFDTSRPQLLQLIHNARQGSPIGIAASQQGPTGSLAGLPCTADMAPDGDSLLSYASSSSSKQLSSSSSSDPIDTPGSGLRICPIQLRTALHNSTALVAAYAPEDAFPSSRQQRQQAGGGVGLDSSSNWWSWQSAGSQRRRLVGFARAVGDSSLIATVHDVAVLPEVQGRGVGAALLLRLTSQLARLGIVDVGLLAPAGGAEAFFEACSFGDDTEQSVTMTLGPAAMQAFSSGEFRWRPARSSKSSSPSTPGTGVQTRGATITAGELELPKAFHMAVTQHCHSGK